MLKGVIIAFAIMLVAIPIPGVHFVAIPISPFVAGFIGGGIAKADEIKIVWFGLIVGALMLIPAAAIIVYWQISDAERFLGAPTHILGDHRFFYRSIRLVRDHHRCIDLLLDAFPIL